MRQAVFLVTIARTLRGVSHLIGVVTLFALLASPFAASSLLDWLVIAGASLGAAVLAYSLLYLRLPALLVRRALRLVPEDQWDVVAAEISKGP